MEQLPVYVSALILIVAVGLVVFTLVTMVEVYGAATEAKEYFRRENQIAHDEDDY